MTIHQALLLLKVSELSPGREQHMYTVTGHVASRLQTMPLSSTEALAL